MLKLNKNKLIPATEIISYWGEIKGDISKQTDLVELTTDLDTSIKGWVESKGYVTAETLPEGIATESWVQSQGYLTEHQDLSSYALKSEIPSLDGYATEQWVEGKGYLTEHQDLSDYALKTEIPSLDGYATEQWVEGKGYLTEHQDLSGYALKTEIPSLDGYATENWVNYQGYMTIYDISSREELKPFWGRNNGYLKYKGSMAYSREFDAMSNKIISLPTDKTYSSSLCNTIGDKVYMYNPYDENRFFIFYEGTLSFIEYQMTIYGSAPTQSYPMWSDSQGRVYYGNKYIFNIDHKSQTVEVIEKDLGGDFLQHSGTIKSNIIKKDGVVYMISSNNTCAYIFNEGTQSFDSSIPVRGKFPSTTFYRYLSEFEGHWIYDVGKEQTELVFHLDGAEPYAEWVVLSERLFPGAWSYEYEGKTINETTRGVYVHPVVKDGVTEYYNFGYKNPVMYKLVNGAWEIVGYNQTVENMTTYIGGCACGTLWFGYGYQSGHTGEIIIWNMDDNPVYYFEEYPEFYGWYDLDSDIEGIKSNIQDFDSRISALETNYGDALNITNQILG